MAKRLNFAAFSAILLIFLLFFVAFDVPVAEAKVCQRRSKTWSGFCGVSSRCDRQCRNWEKANYGACHYQFPGYACFCYFNC